MSVLPAVSGGIVSDIFNIARRILKSSSAQSISDSTLGDYLNRFVVYDLSARIQIQEFRRQYTFETIPNVFEYQAPYTSALTNIFPGNTTPSPPPFISNPPSGAQQPQTLVPIYQTFMPPVLCDGIRMSWTQSNEAFYNTFPEYVNNQFPIQGDGTSGPFTVNFGQNPVLKGFIDDLGNLVPYVFITTVDAAGNQQYIVDSGYVNSSGEGLLIQTDSTFQNIIGPQLTGNPPNAGGSGTVDYLEATATFSFNSNTVAGNNIETQTSPYSAGIPRICLFYNNIFKLFPIPDRAYKIQVDAYVTPTVFFNTSASVPFAYMSEYLARGMAQKILSDNGDIEQFNFYEPLFREQENFVLRRSSRQRSNMIISNIFNTPQSNYNAFPYNNY